MQEPHVHIKRGLVVESKFLIFFSSLNGLFYDFLKALVSNTQEYDRLLPFEH